MVEVKLQQLEIKIKWNVLNILIENFTLVEIIMNY